MQPSMGGEPGFVPREQFQPREQPYPAREPQPAFVPPREAPPQLNRPQPGVGEPRPEAGQELERLPSFITGGAPVQAHQNAGPNGYDNQGDRYMHRRRRRHRPGGPRPDLTGGPQATAGDGGGDAGPGGPPTGE